MYSTITDDVELTRNVLASLAKSWDQRVAVRKERLDLDQYYDESIPDFPASLVPFWEDEDFVGLGDDIKRRLLAAAWIAYNEKAIYLEEAVVQPACGILFRGELPGVGAARIKQVIAQIQVDEQFHILMCLDICHVARLRHGLQDYVFPEPALGVRLKELVRSTSTDNARIAQLAYASVAEMSINAYLDAVAFDMTIQPLHRINTDMHRKDEAAHGIGFSEIVERPSSVPAGVRPTPASTAEGEEVTPRSLRAQGGDRGSRRMRAVRTRPSATTGCRCFCAMVSRTSCAVVMVMRLPWAPGPSSAGCPER